MHNNILIEFVLTNQCNKRCKYCDLDFHSTSQSEENIEAFINFLKKNSEDVDQYVINFFGGEPLLEFASIVKILKETAYISNITFTIGTNGLLLDEEKYNILHEYGVKIYLSIDTETYEHIFSKNFLLNDDELIINFILNPETIEKSFHIFQRLVQEGFHKFSVIPVYITIDWSINKYKELQSFVEMTKQLSLKNDIQVNFYSYYDVPTSDMQFVLDTNSYFYRDVHTHLWFLKQFHIIPDSLKNEIEDFSRVGKLSSNLDILELTSKYNQDDIIKKSFLTPRHIGFELTLRIIDKIINK